MTRVPLSSGVFYCFVAVSCLENVREMSRDSRRPLSRSLRMCLGSFFDVSGLSLPPNVGNRVIKITIVASYGILFVITRLTDRFHVRSGQNRLLKFRNIIYTTETPTIIHYYQGSVEKRSVNS